MTKKVKKRKFNFKRFFLVLLFFVFLILTNLYFSNKHIKNILVVENEYYTDEEIIETAGIENYPIFIKTFTSKLEKKLKKLPLIESVKVSKQWGYKIKIEVKEYKVLFKYNNEFITTNNKRFEKLEKFVNVPTLINNIPDDILNKMIDKFSLLNSDVITKISEIEYVPNNYDKERFVFYMNDLNEVYITLNKLKEFNKYNNIKKQIGINKGILYLDSGNFFEIKED